MTFYFSIIVSKKCNTGKARYIETLKNSIWYVVKLFKNNIDHYEA